MEEVGNYTWEGRECQTGLKKVMMLEIRCGTSISVPQCAEWTASLF